VIVGPVNVDQPFSDGGQNLQRRRRAIDELAIRARRRESPLDDDLSILTRLQAIFIEIRHEGSLQRTDVEDGLDRAGIGATANQGTIGAFAQHQAQSADEDGFSRAGFAGDDVQAALQFQRQVRHEGEVLDAQCGQHGRNRSRRICPVC